MQLTTIRIRSRAATGFTLIELIVSTAITLAVVGATMTALSQAMQANQTALQLTGMNNTLRTGLDLMVRDMLQVGQGLPTGRVILTPSGANSVPMNLPGPPLGAGVTTSYQNVAGDTDMSAVTPGPGLGPIVNNVATDMITVLEADGSFDQVRLTALTSTSMTVEPGVDISTNGPNDVLPGQLIMLSKGSNTALVQITSVNGGQVANFVANDSLRLNQTAAAAGNITALRAAAPSPDNPAPTYLHTTATRIRMVSYYLDAVTTPGRPRLVRRMNNGDPMTFDNNLGNVVAFDVENLQITYDLADGVTNPSGVRMTASDQAGTGACAPNPCSVNQIRKVNILLTGRSRLSIVGPSRQFLHNTLTTQVSLRSLSFVDRYR
jgi:type II secretory pathway pseudopilin PulG